MMLTYASGCSGIEAASVAWKHLGWRCAFVAEVDPAPSRVLMARHGATRPLFPLRIEDAPNAKEAKQRRTWLKQIAKMPEGGDLPNLGDMSRYEEWPDEVVANLDVFIAGTPCQSFSVAGLRQGLNDPRGALMLKYGAIAARARPRWLLWENVPGVLSSDAGRDFAGFLGLLSGQQITPPKEGWQNTGVIPQGSKHAYGLAWRVLDAQFFGVPQRRRRVFVVGHLGDWRPAAAVLFERHSLSGHPPPRRQARQDVAGTIAGGARQSGGYSRDDITHVALDGGAQISKALGAHGGAHGRQDAESETFVIQGGATRENVDSGPDGVGVQANVAYTLEARAEVQMVAFDTTQITSGENRSQPRPGEPCHPLSANAHAPAIAFGIDSDAIDRSGEGAAGTAGERAGLGIQAELAQPIRARGPGAVAFNARQDPISGDVCGPLDTDPHTNAIAINLRGREGGAMPELDDKASLRAASGGSSRSYVQAFQERGRDGGRNLEAGEDVAFALTAPSGGGRAQERNIATVSTVRRLTPLECERLQGFPDLYTRIPLRLYKAAPKGKHFDKFADLYEQNADGSWTRFVDDGPRYKQLGNSMAVPVMRWLGERIAMVQAEMERIAA